MWPPEGQFPLVSGLSLENLSGWRPRSPRSPGVLRAQGTRPAGTQWPSSRMPSKWQFTKVKCHPGPLAPATFKDISSHMQPVPAREHGTGSVAPVMGHLADAAAVRALGREAVAQSAPLGTDQRSCRKESTT